MRIEKRSVKFIIPFNFWRVFRLFVRKYPEANVINGLLKTKHRRRHDIFWLKIGTGLHKLIESDRVISSFFLKQNFLYPTMWSLFLIKHLCPLMVMPTMSKMVNFFFKEAQMFKHYLSIFDMINLAVDWQRCSSLRTITTWLHLKNFDSGKKLVVTLAGSISLYKPIKSWRKRMKMSVLLSNVILDQITNCRWTNGMKKPL